jgi:DNA-binding NarL/FixJ family response regulator
VKLREETIISIHSCDDHHIVTEGLQALLKEVSNLIVSTSNSKEGLMNYLIKENADILMLDVNVMQQNMIHFIPEIKSIRPKIKVVLFTNYSTNEIIREAIKSDIAGFLEKSANEHEIKHCLNCIIAGKKYLSYQKGEGKYFKDNFEILNALTTRELEVLKLLVRGKTNKQIADELFISILTVQTHRKRMYQKLQLKGVNELVSFAYENNLY